MQNRNRCCGSIAVVALAAACSSGGSAGGEIAATAASVEPACADAARATRIVVRGAMPVKPDVSLSGGGSSTIDTRYRAWLGTVELADVRWLDAETLRATVPAGVEPGVYPLVLESPFGARSTKDAAFQVQASGCASAGAGIRVTAAPGLATSELGATATFTIVLESAPTAEVVIGLSSSNPREGTVAPASLSFGPQDWSTPKTVTVTGVPDGVADGPQAYTIVTAPARSADPAYDQLDAADVELVNTDSSGAGITVTPTSGLSTTEAGGTATFTIVLDTQPAADVTVALRSSNTAEGTVSPASVTFGPANWRTPQVVTVTGVDDLVADGPQAYTIVTVPAASTDPVYAGIDPPDVTVTNLDDEAAALVVTPTSGLTTTESGGTATFTVRLASQPTSNVTVSLTSSNAGEGTVSPATLTFTAQDWSTARTATVTGVDDVVADGNQAYAVRVQATAGDPAYLLVPPVDVHLTNVDNDAAGITVSPTSGLRTTESTTDTSHTATFTIRLNTRPTANVRVDLSSSNTGEGTVSPASVTFTPATWSTPVTVTVTGVDDAIADGNQPYTIVTAPAVSTDPRYAGLNAADVSVTNIDNDVASIVASCTPPCTTSEAGDAATISVVLTTQPSSNVTLTVTSSNVAEGTVQPTALTFTPTNYRIARTVIVSGVADGVVDPNQPYSVRVQATAGDATYVALPPIDVGLVNINTDVLP